MASIFASTASFFAYAGPISEICIVSTCSGSKPGFTSSRRPTLLIIRPAPMSSTTAMATSAPTSSRRAIDVGACAVLRRVAVQRCLQVRRATP